MFCDFSPGLQTSYRTLNLSRDSPINDLNNSGSFLTHRSSEGRFVSQCHHVCGNCSSGLFPGEPTCNSSSVQGHTDEGILTIHHSSNQPFTTIKILWHSCVEQVNNENSGLSSLRWRWAERFLNKLTRNRQARPWSLVSILALLHDV